MADSKFETYQQPAAPVVQTIFDVSQIALGQIVEYLEANPPRVPISQITGFTQFAATQAQVLTLETTTSTTYADLATAGPTISGLPDGQYLFLFGGHIKSSAGGTTALMSLSYDGSTPVDADSAGCANTDQAGVSRAVTHTLSGVVTGGHTVKAQYRMGSAGTGTYQNRWLVAIRYANT